MVVVSFDRKEGYVSWWKCKCDCGTEKILQRSNITCGRTTSCGCNKYKTHGKSFAPEYIAWAGMIQRCNNPKAPHYFNYGERGITVCDRWLHSFEDFYADMGDRPSDGHSIERKDVNGNYEPSNCVWATRFEQQRNIRVQKNNTTGVNGVTWSERLHKYIAKIRVNRKTIHLGCFKSLVDAKNARHEAEIKYWGRSYMRPNEPTEPRIIEAIPTPPPVLKFCPYCGSGLLKFIKGVPRCMGCRSVFFLRFSRTVRKSPPPGLKRNRTRL